LVSSKVGTDRGSTKQGAPIASRIGAICESHKHGRVAACTRRSAAQEHVHAPTWQQRTRPELGCTGVEDIAGRRRSYHRPLWVLAAAIGVQSLMHLLVAWCGRTSTSASVGCSPYGAAPGEETPPPAQSPCRGALPGERPQCTLAGPSVGQLPTGLRLMFARRSQTLPDRLPPGTTLQCSPEAILELAVSR
jgi:hypothetical protein